MLVRDPACIYKVATITIVATVWHTGARSPARAVASQTVSPIKKLAITSQVNTAKNIDNIHLSVF